MNAIGMENEKLKRNLGNMNKCDCGSLLQSPYEICPECCIHSPDPDEGYMCLECGQDCAENVLSDAYDRAKDIRKYGE